MYGGQEDGEERSRGRGREGIGSRGQVEKRGELWAGDKQPFEWINSVLGSWVVRVSLQHIPTPRTSSIFA